MKDILNIIKNLYNKETYYQKYGKDVIISIGIIYIFAMITFYYYTLNHLPQIRANWPQNKCNPIYLPLAGLVLNNPNKTNLEQVNENFNQCVQNIVVSIIDVFVEPLLFAITAIIDVAEGIIGSFGFLRQLLAVIRDDIAEIVNAIEHKTLFSQVPLMKQAYVLKNFVSVTVGTFTTVFYQVIGAYYMLKAFGGSIIQLIDELI